MFSKDGVWNTRVIRGMQHRFCRWNIPSDRDARTECVLIQKKLVVIPAKAGAYGPLAQTDQIFHKGRLFQVGPAVYERKLLRCMRRRTGEDR